jgi:CheY-like chemotaxis protein
LGHFFHFQVDRRQLRLGVLLWGEIGVLGVFLGVDLILNAGGGRMLRKPGRFTLLAVVDKNRPETLRQANSQWVGARAESEGPAVLIAEDSEADVFFLLRAFQTAGVRNPVHVVRGGAEAIDYLSGNGAFGDRERYPMPKIVFLDLKMPHPDGFEVLKWKNEQSLTDILWVALSNFDGVKTINQAYAAGATTFLVKPLDSVDVRNLIDAFDHFWTLSGGIHQMAGGEFVTK